MDSSEVESTIICTQDRREPTSEIMHNEFFDSISFFVLHGKTIFEFRDRPNLTPI